MIAAATSIARRDCAPAASLLHFLDDEPPTRLIGQAELGHHCGLGSIATGHAAYSSFFRLIATPVSSRRFNRNTLQGEIWRRARLSQHDTTTPVPFLRRIRLQFKRDTASGRTEGPRSPIGGLGDRKKDRGLTLKGSLPESCTEAAH